MVGLPTLDRPIGVRIPAPQLRERRYASLFYAQQSKQGPSGCLVGTLRQEERPELARMAGQFLVRANLSDTSVHQHHNGVGFADRIVAVRGEQDDLLLSKGRQQLE